MSKFLKSKFSPSFWNCQNTWLKKRLFCAASINFAYCYYMKYFFIIFILSLCLITCVFDPKSKDTSNLEGNSASKILASQIQFDENLAHQYIQTQVDFGPRVPSTTQHAACASWILQKLIEVSDTAYFQEFETVTYDGKKHKGKNIIAKINPKNSQRIQLSAHWDTRPIADRDSKNQTQPILGANDAASGVGVILSLLSSIKKQPVGLGIDIVLFDIEDYGQPENSGYPPMENSWCLGSQYWSKNVGTQTLPRWGILLDMVGGKDATFYQEEISMLYAANLVSRVWENAATLGYQKYFITEKMGTIQDDHLYVNTLANIPMIDIIHYQNSKNTFADYWHTHNDNMSSVDKNTLKAIGSVILYTIYKENNISI